jgi:hypothetical protein
MGSVVKTLLGGQEQDPADRKCPNVQMYSGKMEKYLGEKKFRAGEMVECTQEYFGISYFENEEEEKTAIQFIKGAAKTVAGAGFIVGGAIASIFGGGSGIPLIGAGISMAGNGAADIIEGAIMADSGIKKGACFIKEKLVADMNQFFKIVLPME